MTVPRFTRTILVSAPLTMLVTLGCALALFVYIAPEKAFAQTGTVECQLCYSWNGCECVFTGCGGNSPIIIDTAGNGFHLTSAEAGVVFDIQGNGHPLHIAWTDATSGNAFLALDRNGNGKIDNGKELFGNVTQQPPSGDPNGYLALAVFDKPEYGGNGDGIIDQRDAVFAHLLLWIDENHDGISQPEELHSLPELGVYSLALKYVDSPRTDQFGNQFRYKSAINPDPNDGESTDGRWDYDVFFTEVGPRSGLLPPDVNVSAITAGGHDAAPPCAPPPPTISGPSTVWWFHGQDPNAGSYPTSITLTSSGGSTTTWSVSQPDAKVTLSSTSGAQISVASTGTHFSAAPGDISITATANGADSAPFTITSRTPAELSFLAGQSTTVQDSTYGYITDLYYNVLDQLGSVISGNIYWNEVVGTPSSQNGSNWGIYALQTGGGSTGPLLDELAPPQLKAVPPPTPTPKYVSPPAGTTVYLLATQLISVGSSDSGGDEVQSDNLTYYIDHGAHTSIVIPPAPPK